MKMNGQAIRHAAILVVVVTASGCATGGYGRGSAWPRCDSHPPMRPLPASSSRAMGQGRILFVDSRQGSDVNSGSEETPWRTLARAIEAVEPGETIALRGGIYHESISCGIQGTQKAPITLRSAPGELAVLDAGYEEFFLSAESAWMPCVDGVDGEYVSTSTYPELGTNGLGRRNVGVVGNFADSMIPLHGYHSVQDLRADPAVVTVGSKDHEQGLYCGPGLWFNLETGRIHARLAHTVYEGLGKENYRGQTDPRRLPLVVGGRASALMLTNGAHVVIQDLVLRGTRRATLKIVDSMAIVLDHVSIYGGSPAVNLAGTEDLRMQDCAVRGVSAPWSSRASEKYRGLSSYLLIAGAGNKRIEMANCEFTDCHDGLTIGSIEDLNFHHNLVENFNDDGLYLTTGYPPGSDIRITQNRIARCLSSLSFAGSGKEQGGKIATIARNVFDLRPLINRSHTQMGTHGAYSRPCGDHGSPIWKPMRIIHNTFLLPDSPWRQFYGAGLTRGNMGDVSRRIFNNVFFYLKGTPGLLPQLGDMVVDGNLHWSMDFQGAPATNLLQAARQRGTYVGKHDWFEASKEHHAPGSTANDVIADPLFARMGSGIAAPFDVSLQRGSAGIDAGVAIPGDWYDPLRSGDPGAPDIGALPFGIEMWQVGIDGRITLDGRIVGRGH